MVSQIGVINYLTLMNWKYANDWKKSETTIWKDINGQVYGWKKNYKNLRFTLHKNAEHYVNIDSPKASYLMISEFLNEVTGRQK